MIRMSSIRAKLLVLLTAVLLVSLGLIAAAGETIILGQEDAATGDASQDLKTAATLIKDGYNAGQLSTSKFIFYGNWYGPRLSGGAYNTGKPGNSQPIDELDAIAQRHDFAYDIAAEMGKKYGPHEEARLRALADSIAVREANALPRNPLEWDPPAPDPEKAHEYRRRIGFGFKHTSSIAGAASKALAEYQTIRNLIDKKELGQILPKSSGIDEAELQRQSAERAKTWFQGADVRPIFRIELSASTDLIEEGGAVDVGFRLVPILNEGSQAPGVSREGIDPELQKKIKEAITFEVTGYGEITTSTTDSVRIATTKRWYGLRSAAGTTVTVKASYTGSEADVVEDSVSFGVALATRLTVRASPTYVDFVPLEWLADPDADGCSSFELNAWLETAAGDPVVGMPLTFADQAGNTATATTNDEGHAYVKTELCPHDMEGEMKKDIPFTVTTASPSVDGKFYMMSSETMLVHATRREADAFIRGRVVDKGRNDRPIAGAIVRFTDPLGTDREITTDSNGSFTVSVGTIKSALPETTGTVTAQGYESASFTTTAMGSGGQTTTVGLYPLEATLIGKVVTKTKDGETAGINGSTVHVTSPFDQLIFTKEGEFSITGLYVGDTVTMRADARGFRAYVKSGKITMENPVVTFVLVEGSGEESNVLEEKEADEKERDEVASQPPLYSLMAWATPADPATFQNVTITAQIFPPRQGVTIEIKMHGTDDYASSITALTNAMGKVYLSIPGAASGVIDDIVARIVGTDVKQRLRYSF